MKKANNFIKWFQAKQKAFKAKTGRFLPHTKKYYAEEYRKRREAGRKGYETRKRNIAIGHIREAEKMYKQGYRPNIVLNAINYSVHILGNNWREYMNEIDYLNEYFEKDEWVQAYYTGAWKNLYETLRREKDFTEASRRFWALVSMLLQMGDATTVSDAIAHVEDEYTNLKSRIDLSYEGLYEVWENYSSGGLEEYIDASEWAPPALPLDMFNI